MSYKNENHFLVEPYAVLIKYFLSNIPQWFFHSNLVPLACYGFPFF